METEGLSGFKKINRELQEEFGREGIEESLRIEGIKPQDIRIAQEVIEGLMEEERAKTIEPDSNEGNS